MPAPELASRTHTCTSSNVRDVIHSGFRWKAGASGAVASVVAPLGYTVVRQGTGDYLATLPGPAISGLTVVAALSTGIAVAVSFPAANQIRFQFTGEMPSGAEMDVLTLGPSTNYELGGNNTATTAYFRRHIGDVANYKAWCAIRDGSVIPFSGTFTGGQLTLDSEVSNVTVSKAGTGLFDLNVGIHPTDGQVGIAILSSGVAAKIIGGSGEQGTVRLQTGVTAADPADSVTVQGLILAAALNVD